jgi:hypothetical protein
MQDISAAWSPGPKAHESEAKENKQEVEKDRRKIQNNEDQNIFLLSVFPKESTFSMKESDVPIYFIILYVSDEKKCPGKNE